MSHVFEADVAKGLPRITLYTWEYEGGAAGAELTVTSLVHGQKIEYTAADLMNLLHAALKTDEGRRIISALL